MRDMGLTRSVACQYHSTWATHSVARMDAPGGSMRKSLMLVGIPVAVVGVGVAVAVGMRGTGAKPNDKFAADLQQAQSAGLELAQAQGANKYALTEIAPEAKPQPSKALKQGN